MDDIEETLEWTATSGYSIRRVLKLLRNTCGYQNKKMPILCICQIDEKAILIEYTAIHAIVLHGYQVFDSNYEEPQLNDHERYDNAFDHTITCW